MSETSSGVEVFAMNDYRSALVAHLLFCGASNVLNFVETCDDDEVIQALLSGFVYRPTLEHARMASDTGAVLAWKDGEKGVWDLRSKDCPPCGECSLVGWSDSCSRCGLDGEYDASFAGVVESC